MFATEINLPVHKSSIPNSMTPMQYLMGKVVQAIVVDNQVYADLSDGSAPLGIVSAITSSFKDGEEQLSVGIAFKRMFVETLNYDVHVKYPVNATLYVSDGLLTTKQEAATHPGVAMVVNPPNALDATLRLMWL